MATTVSDAYRKTPVDPSRSKQDIEDLLNKIGAVGFAWRSVIGESEELEAAVQWQGKSRGFRLAVRFEDEKERRQKLRALYWYLKSKIEAITFGLVDLEQEFLPYLIVAGGQTVYEHLGGAGIKLLPEPRGEEGL